MSIWLNAILPLGEALSPSVSVDDEFAHVLVDERVQLETHLELDRLQHFHLERSRALNGLEALTSTL